MLFLSVERVSHPARGRHGGGNGAPGRIRLGEDGADLPGKGEIRIPKGKRLIFETPGGGGFGPPEARDAQALKNDIDAGLVSESAARADYGQER